MKQYIETTNNDIYLILKLDFILRELNGSFKVAVTFEWRQVAGGWGVKKWEAICDVSLKEDYQDKHFMHR